MKTVELSDEELALVTRLREETAKKNAEEEAAKKKAELQPKLEVEFRQAIKQTHSTIQKHLNIAKEQLYLAVAISEQMGIPFKTNLVEFDRDRTYKPASLQKWSELDNLETILCREFRLYVDEFTEDGWEHWSPSSLSC